MNLIPVGDVLTWGDFLYNINLIKNEPISKKHADYDIAFRFCETLFPLRFGIRPSGKNPGEDNDIVHITFTIRGFTVAFQAIISNIVGDYSSWNFRGSTTLREVPNDLDPLVNLAKRTSTPWTPPKSGTLMDFHQIIEDSLLMFTKALFLQGKNEKLFEDRFFNISIAG